VRRDRTVHQFAVPADLSSMHIIRFVMPSKSKALVPDPVSALGSGLSNALLPSTEEAPLYVLRDLSEA
jgi:hypothetical protein